MTRRLVDALWWFERLTEVGRDRVAWEVRGDVEHAIATYVVGDRGRTAEIVKQLWEGCLEVSRRWPILHKITLAVRS